MVQLIEKKRLVGILRGFDFAKVQRLMEKIEEDYEQADRMVVWASYAEKPLKKGGIIDAKGSADSMIKWIKKELGV